MRVKTPLLMTVAALCVPTWDRARADGPDVSEINRRVEAWQPTEAERAFDRIGWAADLVEARRLSRQHRRPVFLFTYDGASLAGYRC